MPVTEFFAGVPVADYAAALAWYERLAGRPADFAPHETESVWRLGPAWIYVVSDAERAGRAMLTLIVDDLEAEVAALAERGLETGPMGMVADVMRKADITDPEGNRITFAEDLSARRESA